MLNIERYIQKLLQEEITHQEYTSRALTLFRKFEEKFKSEISAYNVNITITTQRSQYHDDETHVTMLFNNFRFMSAVTTSSVLYKMHGMKIYINFSIDFHEHSLHGDYLSLERVATLEELESFINVAGNFNEFEYLVIDNCDRAYTA